MGTGVLVSVLIGSIALIIFLIIKLRMHASLALLIAAFGVALVAQVPLGEIADTIESGVGGTLGFLTLIIGFGAVLGKLADHSSSAESMGYPHSLFRAHRDIRITEQEASGARQRLMARLMEMGMTIAQIRMLMLDYHDILEMKSRF